MKSILESVVRHYVAGEADFDVTPLGHGLINDTYRVSSASGVWVLQRLNREVFPEPRWIMENLLALSQHVQRQSLEAVRLQIPAPLLTLQGQAYHIDAEGNFWRGLQCIEPSESRQTLQNDREAAEVGWALGCFHRLCNDLPIQTLHDTLPGFHITPAYFQQYRQVLAQPLSVEASALFKDCVDFIDRHQQRIDSLEMARKRGDLQERVIHGDPKLNNFLFLPGSDCIVSVIDLDTVKPGLLHYDIGDCLRSSCRNPFDDQFDLRLAHIILSHYLQEVGSLFRPKDYDYLYPAIWLIPFELGLRFVIDYMKGDRYFKTTYPQENLHRAQTQFALCLSIECQEAALRQMIDSLRHFPNSEISPC